MTLFTDQFVASIRHFSLEVRPAAPRVAHGAQLSPRSGASLEFRDYQDYTPGDDLRRVDWNVYARTKHLFVRRFEHPAAVPVFVLVDRSASMLLETPSRYKTAARVAAAVASAGLASQNPVFQFISGQTVRPRAATQRRDSVRLLSELAAERSANSVGLADSIRAMQPLLAAKGRGVLVIISDFFEPQGVDELLAVLGLIPQRLVLVRVTQPTDADPGLAGDFELVDCESDRTLPVSVSDDALRHYRKSYHAYFGRIDEFISSRNATGVSIDASAATLPQLERLFPGGLLRL